LKIQKIFSYSRNVNQSKFPEEKGGMERVTDDIVWVEEISKEDKSKIEEVVNNFPKVLPTFRGGFSEIYVVDKKYAIKRTFYYHGDEVIDNPDAGADSSGFPIERILQSDKYLLRQMKGHKNFPTLYGYTGNLKWEEDMVHEDIVIMDYLAGPNLKDLIERCRTRKQQWEIIKKLENPIKKVIVDILNAGWYPVDLRFRCIYPDEECNDFKLIDYNLYQTIDYMIENDSTIDFSDPVKLANSIWERLVKREMN